MKFCRETSNNLNTSVLFLYDTDPTPSGYSDLTTISEVDQFAFASSADYGAVRDKIIEITDSTGFANLSSAEKAIAAEYCASDDNTLVGYYVPTEGSLEAALDKHLSVFASHLEKMREVAKTRINSEKVIIALMKYLEDRFQIDAFTDAIRLFSLDYESKFHKGTLYGDFRDGIMDYIESTGSYVGSGLINYEFSPIIIQAYLDNGGAVDPQNPTAQELQNAEDYTRNLLIKDLKDILIYGKL